MKLEQKIFIQSFTLMIIALYIIGYLLIYNNHTNNIESKIDNSISEHNRILESIHYNYTKLENAKNASIDFNYTYVNREGILELQDIVKIVNDTIKSNQENSIATKIYLYSSGNLLCRNDVILDETTLNNVYPQGDHVYSSILNTSTGKELFISSSFVVNDIEYILITKQNINDIYELKNRNINFFIKIALLSSVLGAIILRFSIHSIVKKLSKLQNDIKEVEMGKDTNITIFDGTDEISTLSKSFGHMTNHLKENIKKMEKKANSNEFFINTLAHEMRGLTTILSSSTELLLTDSSLTEQQKNDCIARIHKSANSIDRIKDSLMELLSINSKSIQKKYINISNIILDSCHTFKQDNKYKKIELFTNIEKDIILFANEDLMKILFKNFLLNSAEASNFQGRIEVYVCKTYFKIVDFGSGIPEDKQNLILQPFVTLGKKDGLGLGLTLCDKIATIHNSYFDIHNNVKKKRSYCYILFLGVIMKFLEENKPFIKRIIILIIILCIALFNMPHWVENLKYTKNIEYINKKYDFSEDTTSTTSASIPNVTGNRNLLSSKEAKENLNLIYIYNLIDVIFKYRMNNLDDYQYSEHLKGNTNSNRYIVLSKEDFTEDLLNPFTIIESKEYGNVYYLKNDFFLLLLISENGENIYFYRGFNYTSEQKASFNLDSETLNWLLNYAKEFFSNFSTEKSNKFDPKYSYLDESGHVYTLIDEENNLRFSYDFLYNCPCSFSIGF